MTTKEKIIRLSIEEIQKKVAEIDLLLLANPLTEILKIRNEAQILLVRNNTIQSRSTAEFINKINELAKREKHQFEIAEKSKDSIKLIDSKIDLEFELGDLENELYFLLRKENTKN
jgi:hypothetical protein